MLNVHHLNIDPKKKPEVVSIRKLFLPFIAIILGITIATITLPKVLPNLYASLIGNDPKVFWYLARGSAFAAFIALWLSMVLGLTMTTKTARYWPGNAAAYDIHQFLSLLGIGFALFHALILLGDHYIGFNLMSLFIPFLNTNYRPLWVSVGQIGLYLWLFVVLSFYVRKMITTKVWRLIHYSSFFLYMMALIHGIMSGTDSGQLWVITLYWISGGILLWLLLLRILLTGQATLMSRTFRHHGGEGVESPL